MPRSRPLRLDKTTGEPKVLLPVQQNKPPWKLVVLDRKKHSRKVKLYHSYSEAKRKAAEVAEKYGDRVEVGVVSRQTGYGPPYSKVSDGQLWQLNMKRRYWCPYCRAIRKFPSVVGVKRCEFCQTRITDFHVIKCNPALWLDKEE